MLALLKRFCVSDSAHTAKSIALPPIAWLATILGNLHKLPVPTALPSIDSSTPSEEEKVPCNDTCKQSMLGAADLNENCIQFQLTTNLFMGLFLPEKGSDDGNSAQTGALNPTALHRHRLRGISSIAAGAIAKANIAIFCALN
jgi:hypothetical protein